MKKEAKVKDKNDILEFSNGEYEFEKEIENISFNVMVEKSVLIKKETIDNSNPNFINISISCIDKKFINIKAYKKGTKSLIASPGKKLKLASTWYALTFEMTIKLINKNIPVFNSEVYFILFLLNKHWHNGIIPTAIGSSIKM